MIYLDYAAHAPADPAVLERFCDMERRFTANPNSGHAAGRAAREQMACAAEQIASLTGAAPSEVIFTSGATEANNLAIKGIAQAARHIGRHIGGVDVGKKGLRGLADGFPPVVGVLVDPCTVMNVKIVRIDCTLYQFSLAGEERGLVAGSTQIMCQQISGHSIILPLFSNLESNDQNLMTIFSAGSRLAMTWKALSVSPNGKT